MSKAFKKYLKELHNKDEDSMAALRGNRNEARSNAGAAGTKKFN
jgi:hypothetical protein